jgi:hypothetical protein
MRAQTPQKVNRLGGLPTDVQHRIMNQLPLESALRLYAASKSIGMSTEVAHRIMWSRKNPTEALKLQRTPAFTALLKDHPIVVAGLHAGWGSDAYCDRILRHEPGAMGREPMPSIHQYKQRLLAWAGANGCPWSVTVKDKVTELSIPDGIGALGDKAFTECPNLVTVRFPRSLTRIGPDAFSKCSSLTSVDFSAAEHLARIDAYAFNGAPLTQVSFPPTLKELHQHALAQCQMESVSLPASVTLLGDGVFVQCAKLISVDMSALLHIFELSNTFRDCVNLKDVKLPPKLTKIGTSAMGRCRSLTSVHLPDSLTTIGYSAFTHCESLASIRLPVGLKHIGMFAFDGCVRLNDVSLPASIQSIDRFAFIGCTNASLGAHDPRVLALVRRLQI